MVSLLNGLGLGRRREYPFRDSFDVVAKDCDLWRRKLDWIGYVEALSDGNGMLVNGFFEGLRMCWCVRR